MHSVIEAFGLSIQSYSLFAAIAALVCAAMAYRPLLRAGFSRRGAAVLLLCACAAFLIGARLWNVAVNPGDFGPQRPWYVLRMTGFSLYGGLAGAFAAIALCSRAFRVKLLPVLDAMTIPGAAAFCIARVGCFLNGCCGGIKTHVPWGVVFPSELDGVKLTFLTLKSAPVHPTQIYEIYGALAFLLFVLLICRKIEAKPGTRFLLYAAFFSAMRLLVLPLRSLPYPGVVTKVLYPGLYLAIILIGIVWAVKNNRRDSHGEL